MNILIVTPECVPFAKTGGLADVTGALPGPVSELGHEVSLMMPLYRSVRQSGFAADGVGLEAVGAKGVLNPVPFE